MIKKIRINESLIQDVGGEFEKYLGPHIGSLIYEYATKIYLLGKEINELQDKYINLISDKQKQEIFNYLDILHNDVTYLDSVINNRMK